MKNADFGFDDRKALFVRKPSRSFTLGGQFFGVILFGASLGFVFANHIG
ncbi:hypothetical protein [Burkholderia sp. Ac-20349]|nr:hypothetical protein [Burkholderia sp. Ac-20349]MBN3839218.1 hypothetical protein [Burkholderia sp. Ac-20349]